ncbi:MAG: S-layer homology domain-containing protein [Clostridia bacterium]
MKRTKTTILLCLVLVFSLTSCPTAIADVSPGDEADAAEDTWYYDLENHWSRPYILTLWEEGVTDGYAYPVFDPGWDWTYAYDFLPEDPMTRAQIILMMSRVFALEPDNSVPSPWPDLPPTYTLYSKPVYAEIRAAAHRWQIAPEGGNLNPSDDLTRMYSVRTILSALGLTNYAEGLGDGEVEALLDDFADSGDISDHGERALVAAAVDLGLIIGYGDGTLRMDRKLTRAEGATILYRCCLMRVKPEYGQFFPDGDGYRETLPIEVTGLRNASNVRWQVQIENREGNVVTTLPSNAPIPGDPHDVSWNGDDSTRDPVEPGRFFIGGWVEDRRGNQFSAVRVPVDCIHRTLSADLSRDLISNDEKVTITAQTHGCPPRVTAATGGGNVEELHPVDDAGNPWEESLWELQIRPRDLDLVEGNNEIAVTAHFDPLPRERLLHLEVENGEDTGEEEEDETGEYPNDPPEDVGDVMTTLVR